MLGGKRDRIAEAEPECLVDAVPRARSLGLVCDDDDRLAGAAHGGGEMPVSGGEAGARVDDKQDRVAILESLLRLRAHAPGERFGIALLEARRVDDRECEIGKSRVAFAAVAGDARLVIDQRELASHQTVEQRRFADVRPADDRDPGAQSRLKPVRPVAARVDNYFAAVRFAATSPSQRRRQLPLVRRHFGIPKHEIELLGGVVIVLPRQRQRREIERGQAPKRSLGGGKSGQLRFALLLLAGNVRPDQRRTKTGGVAQKRIDRGVAGDRIESGRRARRIALGPGASRGHLRERPIAARPLGRDLVETRFRLVELAALERRERLLKLIPSGLLRPFALILPIAKPGRGEHDKRSAGQDQVLVFLPELRRLVAPDFLVNFVKDVAHA